MGLWASYLNLHFLSLDYLIIVIDCSVTNYPKRSGLKHHTYIISQFPWVRKWHSLAVSASLTMLQSRCCQRGNHLKVQLVKIHCQVHSVVPGRLQFLSSLLAVGWTLRTLPGSPLHEGRHMRRAREHTSKTEVRLL